MFRKSELQGGYIMSAFAATVKSVLETIITNLLSTPKEFARKPESDFTRNNGKLPADRMFHVMLGMSKGTIATELREYFGAAPEEIPTASAFVQQRGKILPKAFETIFRKVNEAFSPYAQTEDVCLVAADGSDVRFYGLPGDTEYICNTGEQDCHMLHINALLNLSSNRYIDAEIQPVHEKNEYQALCTMVDRYPIKHAGNTVFLADRGYASCNVFAHILKKV